MKRLRVCHCLSNYDETSRIKYIMHVGMSMFDANSINYIGAERCRRYEN